MSPPMLGMFSMGSSILGGIMGAGSSMAAGQAQSQMGFFQAAVAQRNAEIARQNADYASVQGEQAAMQYGMKARQQLGEIRAQQGVSGLDVNAGSARDVQTSQQIVSRMDIAQIRQNAAKAAYDYRVQASGFDTEAMMDVAGAQNALVAGKTNALASIVSGAGSVADKWLKGNQTGMWENA